VALNKSKKGTTAILTDTRVKETLREIENSKKQLKQKSNQRGSKSLIFGKPAKESKHKMKVNKMLFCMDSFSNSVAGEEWVQCTHCQMCAHEKSIGGVSLGLICPSCNSDDSDEDF
jgi:hypothetical protein